MKVLLRNKIIYILLSAMLLLALFFVLPLNNEKTVFAEEMDYVNQDYQVLPDSFNVQTEGVVFKIHCPDIRSTVGDDYVEEHVTRISFKASSGCQIYFVEGVACSLEDCSYEDSEWDEYANYYEILHYDSDNKNVYIKFKNLSELDADETVDACLEDLSILSGNTSIVNLPQYCYLSNMQAPVAEITADDVFFSSEVKAAHGGNGWTNYNIYSLEYTLKLSQRVSHLVDSIDISFVKGGDSFTLYKSSLSIDDGFGQNGFHYFDVPVLGNLDDITVNVKLQATITYGDKTITVQSSEKNLISLWIDLVNSNFSGYDYQMYMTGNNQSIIRKIVAAYNSGFFTEIKSSSHYFANYNNNSAIKLTSLIFKIPLTDFNYASFSWNSGYWQGYVYTASVRFDSDLKMSTIAYKMTATETGLVSDNATIVYDDSVASSLYNGVLYFAYDNYLYVKITDDSSIATYFPQRVEKSFSASARNKSYSSLTIQANTATIIYDEYNNELLSQITALNSQLEELQALLDASNGLNESSRERLSVLQSSLNGLEVENSNLESELAYLNEQIDVMREEYQKKISQLLSENENSESSIKQENNDDETSSNTFTKKQILIISFGVLLIAVIVILCMPRRRRL